MRDPFVDPIYGDKVRLPGRKDPWLVDRVVNGYVYYGVRSSKTGRIYRRKETLAYFRKECTYGAVLLIRGDDQ